MKIHAVFHVSLLEQYVENDIPGRIQPPPPSVTIEDQVEHEVEEVLDSKIMRKRLFYLVKWKGYPVSENSWEPAPNLSNAKDLVDQFHAKYPEKPSAPAPPSPAPTASRKAKRKGRPKRKVNFIDSTVIVYWSV